MGEGVAPGSRAATRSTRTIFLILGIVAAAWAPLVPDLKLRLALDDAELGLMLLGIGGGSLIAAPLTGLAVARVGCRAVMLGLGAIFCMTLPALTIAPGIAATAAALVIFGATLAGIDVAMNIQAVAVERAVARPMMSGFHALFSVGGLMGASIVSALLYAGASPLTATLVIAGAALIFLFSQATGMLTRAENPRAVIAVPRGRLALIGALCFIAFMAEGAVHDWTAVLLRFHRDAGPATAGLAYAAFASAMTLGRLTGDAVLKRVSPVHVLAWGAAIAAAGFIAMTAVPTIAAALIGCALIGIGEANVVPALFSAAARIRGTDPGLAIAAVASPGYVGLLAGPPLIGIFAQATTLPIALGGAGLLLLLIAATARMATREEPG